MKYCFYLLCLFHFSFLHRATAQQLVQSASSTIKGVGFELSPEEKMQFQKEAALTAAYLIKKYEGDAGMEKAIINFYYARSVALKKTWSSYQGSSHLEEQMSKVIEQYDTIETRMLYVAKANSFFKRQLSMLNSIKPLLTKESNQLHSLFLKACQKNMDKSYADYFNEVMRFVIKDTLYYATIYKDEILYQSRHNASKAIYDLVSKNQITKDAMKEIVPLVTGKERSLSVINYAFSTYNTYKDSVYTQALTYYDSLISLALKRDGTFKITSKFSTAVKNRHILKLRNGQVDSLLNLAFTLEKMQADYASKSPLGKFDATTFEAQHIPIILSDDQYLRLLGVINKPQAEKWAFEDWTELVKRGMSKDLDSTLVIRQLMQYNINRLVAKDRYANDKVQQNAQINAIDSTMPEALRRLKSARRRDTSTKDNNTAIPGSIQW